MTRIEYLQDQADRAERLCRSGLDRLTTDRLRLFAAECRIELDYLRTKEPRAHELSVRH